MLFQHRKLLDGSSLIRVKPFLSTRASSCYLAIAVLCVTFVYILPRSDLLPMSLGQEEGAAKSIPLSSVYGTSRQTGLKRIDLGHRDGGFEVELRELYQAAIKTGASNLFLVCGEDLPSAVRATRDVFRGGRSVNRAVNADPEVPCGKYWFVVYIGISGSSPAGWRIDAIQVKGNRVQLRYTNARPEIQSDDEFPYFVWVPLGSLNPGTYVLELHDEVESAPVLQRRVAVNKPGRTQAN